MVLEIERRNCLARKEIRKKRLSINMDDEVERIVSTIQEWRPLTILDEKNMGQAVEHFLQ